MATIRMEQNIRAGAEDVWSVIGDFATGPHRMAPGFALATSIDGDCRTVTFANGSVVRERLVSRDDAARRIVYAVVDSADPPDHDNASMEVIAEGPERCRFVWLRDVLPDCLASSFGATMAAAMPVIKETLEGSGGATGRRRVG